MGANKTMATKQRVKPAGKKGKYCAWFFAFFFDYPNDIMFYNPQDKA